MRKEEQRLWDAVKRNTAGSGVLFERIENRAGDGTPDFHALDDGLVTWVELKATNEIPVRPGTPVFGSDGMRLSQRNWHLDYTRHKGRSLILVRVVREVLVIPGRLADSVNPANLSQLRLLSIVAPSTTYDGFLAVIKGKVPL